ncbi:hypothetical protein AGOR_G00182730 [Albula goreensis]|uniref:Uncharacterized protein n=1 Tax=Albula goreensis TaxID=1534307 RepID=A0A8T3CV54_9TELE|nr:hypothetical protein AGOR_G00182730 [Albula goreensis]
MFFWIVLIATCSVDLSRAYWSTQTETECLGSTFEFPVSAYEIVEFLPKNGGANRILYRNRTIQDSRYELRSRKIVLLEITHSDVGRYMLFPQSNLKSIHNSIFLKVKDCSEKEKLLYGDQFTLWLSREAAVVQFSADLESNPVTLWNKSNPSEGLKGKVKSGVWTLDTVTQADNGYYTLRNREGKFLSRVRLFVDGHMHSFLRRTGETLEVPLRISGYKFRVYFSEDDGDESQLIYDRGDSFEDRIIISYDEFQISELRGSDSGEYRIVDLAGNLAYVVQLTVEGPDYMKYLPVVALAIGAVLLCCCIRKVCCKKKPPPPAQPVVYGADPSPAQSVAPSVPTQPQWSGTGTTWKPGPSTPGYTCVFEKVTRPTPVTERGSSNPSQGYTPLMDTAANPSPAPDEGSSCLTQGVGEEEMAYPSFPISYDCLHSDHSGIQFEMEKGSKATDFFSTLPLNTDKPGTSNVYTSDKLNFL